MRKIFVLIAIIITALVINFSLWVAHTRTIHRAVTVMKHNLAIYGITFYYDDLYFDSFKSWSVEGTLKNVTISTNIKNVTRVVDIQAVNFNSLPFSERIEISIPKSLNYTIRPLKGKEELLLIEFPHGNPTLEVDFITSLNSTNDAVSEHNHNPFFINIKKLTYYDSGFEIINRENAENYLHSGSNKWELLNISHDGIRSLDYEIKFSDLSSNPKLSNQDLEIPQSLKNKLTAKSDFYTQGNLSIFVSDEQLEYIEQMKQSGKDSNIKQFLDTYRITINKFDIASSEYKLSITGEIQKYLNVFIPTFDLTLTVSNYNNLVDMYFESLNIAVDQLKKLPNSPVQDEVTPNQVSKVKSILTKFSDNNDTLKMHFTGTKDGVFEISGRPLLEVWIEVQAIFFANIKEDSTKKPKIGNK